MIRANLRDLFGHDIHPANTGTVGVDSVTFPSNSIVFRKPTDSIVYTAHSDPDPNVLLQVTPHAHAPEVAIPLEHLSEEMIAYRVGALLNATAVSNGAHTPPARCGSHEAVIETVMGWNFTQRQSDARPRLVVHPLLAETYNELYPDGEIYPFEMSTNQILGVRRGPPGVIVQQGELTGHLLHHPEDIMRIEVHLDLDTSLTLNAGQSTLAIDRPITDANAEISNDLHVAGDVVVDGTITEVGGVSDPTTLMYVNGNLLVEGRHWEMQQGAADPTYHFDVLPSDYIQIIKHFPRRSVPEVTVVWGWEHLGVEAPDDLSPKRPTVWERLNRT